MAAYVIVSYDVTDQDGFGPYVPGVMPLIAKHNGEVLVADFNAETLEGDVRGVNVVLRFPSKDDARAFYDDPEYVPVRQVRLDSTDNGTIALAEEFVMPSE